MDIQDSSGTAMMIVKFCIVLIIGVVMLSGIGTNNLLSSTSTITITLSGDPADGDTITLDGVTYEFDDTDSPSTLPGNIPVALSTSGIEITQANLRAAIDDHYGVV